MEEPHPPHQNAQDAEGEAERHAIRLNRQAAIRAGRYLPPLPQLANLIPPLHIAHLNPVNDAFDRAMEMHIHNRREHLLQRLRPGHLHPGGIIDPGDEDYRPMSPTNSDDEIDEVEEALERNRIMRRNWRQYMNQRVEPIPQEMIERLLREYDDMADQVMNNNNRNFRNFNGGVMLSPSLSPSPGASPEQSDDEEEEMEQFREQDNDVEMLNVQMLDMRPNEQRQRKRQNSEGEIPLKKKKVTFKDDSSDETADYDDDSCDSNETVKVNRKQFDDDDEGFLGGPSSHQNNIPCA